MSRTYIQSLFKKGLVTLGGRSIKKGHVLTKGDKVLVDDFIRPDERTLIPNPSLVLQKVHEAGSYWVIDKPSGLPTHPNDFEDTHTVANALLAAYPSAQQVGEDPLRPGIVHRLDTHTSGLLILALTPSSFVHFRTLFNERKVKKSYLALVLGRVEKAGEIHKPIAHHEKNPRKMVVVEKGARFRSTPREATTLYEPINIMEHHTLLLVKTLTGRMHQVRVHLSSIGHPLCGDRLYQKPGDRPKDRSGLTHRHFLHANQITFTDPDGRSVTLSSALPAELQAVVGSDPSLSRAVS